MAEERISVPLTREELALLFSALVHQEDFDQRMAAMLRESGHAAAERGGASLERCIQQAQALRAYLDHFLSQPAHEAGT